MPAEVSSSIHVGEQAEVLEQADIGAGGQRRIRPPVLPQARGRRVFVVSMAETAPRPGAGAIRAPGDQGAGGNEPALELELTSGERLRIGRGVDPPTLRMVLEAVRA